MQVLHGPLVQRPVECDQHFHSFIHSPPNIQGSYQALYGDTEMDKHSSCPWRVYNDGGVGCEDEMSIEISQIPGRQTMCFLMRCFETYVWRNQRKLPRGGGIGVEP